MLAGLSGMTNDFTDSWIDWLLNSVVHDVFHIISSASQPPFVHSLIRLAARKKNIASVSQTRSYRPLISYSEQIYVNVDFFKTSASA